VADTTITSIAEFNALTNTEIDAGDVVKINGQLSGKLELDFSGTAGNPVIIASLSGNSSGSNVSGVGVFPAFSTLDQDHVTLQNMDFSGAESTAGTSQTIAITSGSTGVTLKQLNIHDTPIGIGLDLASGDGVRVTGSGNIVTDCTLNNFQNDGIYCAGSNNTFRNLHITNASQREDEANGDSLKWSSDGDCSDCLAELNIFDHTSARDKAPHIMAGNNVTTGMLSQYNKYMGGQRSILLKGFAQTIARRGLVQPTEAGNKHGSEGPVIPDSTGVRMESNSVGATFIGHLAESLVIESVTLGRTTNNAVFTTNGNHVVRGCTIVCDVSPLDTSGSPVNASQFAQVLFGSIGSAAAGTTFQNNIVFGPNNTALTYFVSASSGESGSRVPDVLDNANL